MTTIALRFDSLEDGTLVALATHDGRTVAAIVHPSHETDAWPGHATNWSLAGDVDRAARPKGSHASSSMAVVEATQALERELGIRCAVVVNR